jgi:hypothetical protein
MHVARHLYIELVENSEIRVRNKLGVTAFDSHKKLKPILLGGAWYSARSTPYTYNVWWPYVNNYYGTGVINGFARFIWIDPVAKKALGF